MLCAAVFAYTGMRTHRGEGRRLDLHLILNQNLGSAGMRTHRGEGGRRSGLPRLRALRGPRRGAIPDLVAAAARVQC